MVINTPLLSILRLLNNVLRSPMSSSRIRPCFLLWLLITTSLTKYSNTNQVQQCATLFSLKHQTTTCTIMLVLLMNQLWSTLLNSLAISIQVLMNIMSSHFRSRVDSWLSISSSKYWSSLVLVKGSLLQSKTTKELFASILKEQTMLSKNYQLILMIIISIRPLGMLQRNSLHRV